MSDFPKCPRCGEPARVVVLIRARVRAELKPDQHAGRILSITPEDKEKAAAGYECGGGHYWDVP